MKHDDHPSPLSLRSKDATLPDQSTLGSDAPPSEVRLQKMINDRYSPISPTSGMTISEKDGIPGN